MTTSTTVLGMTPLAIGIGEGAEIMRPLALTVVGGLSIAMFLTLLVVPCLYLIVSSIAERAKTWLTGSSGNSIQMHVQPSRWSRQPAHRALAQLGRGHKTGRQE